MALSDGELAGIVLGAGFSGNSAVTAVAVSLAESGGNPQSMGDIKLENATWGPSVGLFQIRSLKAQKGTGGQRDELANVNPTTNAKNAFAISSGGSNWRPWSTYTSGAYLAFMPRARNAVASPTASTSNATTGNPGNGAAGSVQSGLSTLLSPGTWARMGAFILGGLLLVFTLYRATNAGKYIKSAVKTAGKVAAVA